MDTKPSTLIPILRRLKAKYGAQSPPPATNAFELVIWEKVAYLATDERRAAAFERLRRAVGLTPKSILAAKRSILVDVLATGGIAAPERANNLIAAAELVVGEFDGALDAVCSRPLPDAKRQLKRIYGIADPGAEKILLLTRKHPVMGLDSNGLRVLTRLGFGVAAKTYGATYKSATEAVTPEFRGNIDAMIDANLLLRHHGQTVCKTTRPRCGVCVLRAQCPSASKTPVSSLGRVAPSG
jgi:endonuclease III